MLEVEASRWQTSVGWEFNAWKESKDAEISKLTTDVKASTQSFHSSRRKFKCWETLSYDVEFKQLWKSDILPVKFTKHYQRC